MSAQAKVQNRQIGTYYKETLQNGKVVFRKSIRLGRDATTGKEIMTKVTANSFAELKAKIEQKKRDFQAGGNAIVKRPKKQFKELAQAYLEMYLPTIKPGTVKSVKNLFNTYIVPELGELRVDKITPTVVQETFNKWALTASSSNEGKKSAVGKRKDIKGIVGYVRGTLDYGITLGWLAENPASKVEAPTISKNKHKEIPWFTKEQVHLILDRLEGFAPHERFKNSQRHLYGAELFKVYIRLLLFSGLRAREALALEWSDIDFASGALSVTKTVNSLDVVQDSTKTETSARTIGLDTSTIDILKRWKQNQETFLSEPVGYLFATYDKSKLSLYKIMNETSQRYLKELGLPTFGLHAFRHTHVSLMMAAQIPYKDIQLRLGHKDVTTTMDFYGHLEEHAESDALKRLNSYLDKSVAIL